VQGFTLIRAPPRREPRGAQILVNPCLEEFTQSINWIKFLLLKMLVIPMILGGYHTN